MKFTIQKSDRRPWPVIVTRQVCDPATGEVVELKEKFVVYFGAWKAADLVALQAEAQARHPAPAGAADDDAPLNIILARNAYVFPKLIEGWGAEVQDASGAPLAYRAELLAELVQGQDGLPLSAALWRAVHQINLGLPPAKNAETSPVPGPTPSTDEGAVVTSLPTI